jgi:hypothetical protein
MLRVLPRFRVGWAASWVKGGAAGKLNQKRKGVGACNTSGVKHALSIANHEHEHHRAFIIT